jgi:hypothetical protein
MPMNRGASRGAGWTLLATAVALMLSACDSGRGPSSLSGSPPNAAASPTTAAPSPSTSPGQNAAATTVPFDLMGTGDRDLVFETSARWNIAWSFDCANLGTSGPFMVTVDGVKGFTHPAANSSGMQGRGTLAGDSQDGRFRLALRSACQWHLVATS